MNRKVYRKVNEMGMSTGDYKNKPKFMQYYVEAKLAEFHSFAGLFYVAFC